MKKIIFAGGCFWGVEAYFMNIKGVISTEVGYANGNRENPTYELVCTGISEFAEACVVEYDENIIKLEELLEKFFNIINPFLLNRQAGDIGTQYRTGIYYKDKMDFYIIEQFIKTKSKEFEDDIVTEVKVLDNYYRAEEYHQKYLVKNPNGYCHIKLD